MEEKNVPDNSMHFPYDDEFMVFDKLTGQYLLTEKAFLSRGIDIRGRLSATSTINPEGAILFLSETVSAMIYQYIHEHNMNNAAQDCFIAKCPQVRPFLFRVLLFQAVYVMQVGNLYLSTDPSERANAIDPLAKSMLGNEIPGLGYSLLYTGRG